MLLELLRLWLLLSRGRRHRHRGLPLGLRLLRRVALLRIRLRSGLLLLVLRG